MRFALVVGGSVTAYPYTFRQLRLDNPDVSFPSNPTEDVLAAWGVLRVTETARPPSTTTTDYVEGTPVFNVDHWEQVWVASPVSPEEQARREERAAITQEVSAAKLDPWLVGFLGMTPDEARQWVIDNVTDLASARTTMSRLAYVLRVLVRREFNR